MLGKYGLSHKALRKDDLRARVTGRVIPEDIKGSGNNVLHSFDTPQLK